MLQINKTTISSVLATAVLAALAVPNALAQTGTQQSNDIVADVARERATNFLNNDSLSLTADIELDFDYNDREDDGNSDDNRNFDAGGRVRLTIDGNHTAGSLFVSGRAELLLKEDGNADTDDAWMAFGDALWDVKLGRFEAANLFPLGLDTIINNADGVNIYEVNLARGRVGGSGGQAAFHLKPNDQLNFELAGVWGDPQEGNNKNIGGIRPAVTFKVNDAFTIGLGGEYVNYETNELVPGTNNPVTDVNSKGGGITLGYTSDNVLVNVNAAYQNRSDSEVDADTTTLGANLIYIAARNKLGLGVIYSDENPKNASSEHVTTVYGAYVIPLFFERAAVTFAGSYSSSSADVTNDNVGALRVRFNYAF